MSQAEAYWARVGAFAVRIVVMDTVLVPPTPDLDPSWSSFQGHACQLVPVARFFGATPEGQHCTLHLHGAFPYFFVASPLSPAATADELCAYARRLAAALDVALALGGGDRSAAQYVYAIEPVRARSVYGYHATEAPFLKVLLYNPRHVTRVTALLRSGAVLNTSYAIFEAHLPFELHLLADYRLAGMDLAHFERVRFRHPLPPASPTLRWCQSADLPQEALSPLPKNAFTELEVDALAPDVLNARAMTTVPRDGRLVASLAQIWDEERARRVSEGDATPLATPHTQRTAPTTATAEPPTATEVAAQQRARLNAIIGLEREALRARAVSNEGAAVAPLSAEEVACTQHSASELGVSVSAHNKGVHVLVTQVAPGLTHLHTPFAVPRPDLPPATPPTRADLRPLYAYPLDALSQTLSPTKLRTAQRAVHVEPLAETEAPATQSSQRLRQLLSQEEDWEARDLLLAMHQENGAEEGRAKYEEDDDDDDDQDDQDEQGEQGAEEEEEGKVEMEVEDSALLDLVAAAERDPLPVATQRTPNSQTRVRREWQDIISSQRDVERSLKLDMEDVDQDQEELEEDPEAMMDLEVPSQRLSLPPTSPLPSQQPPLPSHLPVPVPVPSSSSPALMDSSPFSSRLLHKMGRARVTLVLESPPASPPTPTRASSTSLSLPAHPLAHSHLEHSQSLSMVSPSLPPRTLALSSFSSSLPPSPWAQPSPARVPRVPVPGLYRYMRSPPSFAAMEADARARGPSSSSALVKHVPAHYSRAEDSRSASVASTFFAHAQHSRDSLPPLLPLKLTARDVKALPMFNKEEDGNHGRKTDSRVSTSQWYAHVRLPPPRALVLESVPQPSYSEAMASSSSLASNAPSLRAAPAPKAFIAPLAMSSDSVAHVTVLALEVLVVTRGALQPNPQHDAVAAIVCHVRDHVGERSLALVNCATTPRDEDARLFAQSLVGLPTQLEHDECSLFAAFVSLVRRLDPDVLVGYEVEALSLGFLVERARVLSPHPLDLCDALARTPQHAFVSRVPGASVDRTARSEYERGGDAHVTGRIVLTLWRVMRSELHEQAYSFEHCAWRVLQERHPSYAAHALTAWWRQPRHRARALRHVLERAKGDVAMLAALNVLGRSAEMARLYGCDLWSVLSRGSQYKVEAMLCRLSKAQNQLLYAPSKAEVAQQRAPECIALVMEPQSLFYSAPMLVLDFQSLYPSIVIAYNLCYSTCLGALRPAEGHDNSRRLGVSRLSLPLGLLELLSDAGALTITPNDIVFLSGAVQRGVVPQMLSEILETRIMVKQAMKRAAQRGETALQRTLDARQLALKMLANVTYGYAGANYSGRMPCVDLADAIVQTARETLEAAAKLVARTPKWGARVVYGDTDSLFVLCEGATRERAFAIGREIAEEVTKSNPAPVKLNFEKVYHPCVLVTKKRYSGWKWESERGPPVFEAKGIETVRRDTCPLVSTTLRGALERLFVTRDLSQVKRFVQAQCAAVLSDTLPLSMYTFRKEVRLGTYAQPPPAALVAAQLMSLDPRAEPRYGERVPYVVLAGPQSARLQDLVASPLRVLQDAPHSRINARYYVTKALLPALHRVLACAGVDVFQWYATMPRSQRVLAPPPMSGPGAQRPLAMAFTPPLARSSVREHARTEGSLTKGVGAGAGNPSARIDTFYRTTKCAVCDARLAPASSSTVCPQCAASPVVAQRRISAQHALRALVTLCSQCAELDTRDVAELACQSLDCEVLYARLNAALAMHALGT